MAKRKYSWSHQTGSWVEDNDDDATTTPVCFFFLGVFFCVGVTCTVGGDVSGTDMAVVTVVVVVGEDVDVRVATVLVGVIVCVITVAGVVDVRTVCVVVVVDF